MPNINDMMPSKFLKKSDVEPPKLVTITNVSRENVAKGNEPEEFKYVVHFKETDKPLVLTAQQEKTNADQINAAMSARDVAITKLRDQARAHSLRPALAAESSSRVCYRPEGLNTAYREFVAEIRAIAGEGQNSVIDNNAWLESWPR